MSRYTRSYFNKLSSRDKNELAKIPKVLVDKLLLSKHRIPICTLFELKTIFYNGEFYECTAGRREALAQYLGMSKNTLNRHLQHLYSIGLITYTGTTIKLASWHNIINFFVPGYSGKIKFFYVEYAYARDTILQLRILAIKGNLRKQEIAIEEKILKNNYTKKEETKLLEQIKLVRSANIANRSRQRISSSLIMKLEQLGTLKNSDKKKAKKSGLLNQWYKSEMTNFFKNSRKFDMVHPINFDTTISCQKTANIFGCKSKSTGHYWQRKLEDYGFFEVERRAVLLDKEDQSIMRLVWSMEEGALRLHHFINPGGIWKRLNNRFHFPN